jgi:hypothetical protein
VPGRQGVGAAARHGPGDGVVASWAPGVWRRGLPGDGARGERGAREMRQGERETRAWFF